MRRLALVLLFAIGCGSGKSDRDPFNDTAWAAPISGFNCEMGFLFGSASDYTFVFTCILNDGSQAVAVENGYYDVFSSEITMTAFEASCPPEAVTRVVTFPYTMTATTLSLRGATGVATFAKFTPGPPSAGTVTTGCFDGDLFFTPRAITPL